MGEATTPADNLRLAVEEGKLDTVKEYFSLFTVDDDQQIRTRTVAANGVELEIVIDRQLQYNLLRLAIGEEHQEIIELLVAKGFPVNFEDLEVDPLLHTAVLYENFGIVKFLLENGANTRAVSTLPLAVQASRWYLGTLPFGRGTCALHCAAALCEDLVSLLLDYGADLYQLTQSSNWSAMHYAATADQLEVVKLLFDRGLSADHLDNTQQSPVCYAACYGRMEVFSFLLERVSDENMKNIVSTALYNCLKFNEMEVIEILVKLNGGVNAVIPTSPELAPPLYFACLYGKLNVAKYLINQGADVQAICGIGLNALYTAIRMDKDEAAKLLLDHGADVNIKVHHQKTALHRAAKNGKTSSVELLVEYGADILAKDDSGKTPLDYAVERHFTDSAKVLIKRLVETHHHDLNDCQDLSMINEQLTLKIYYDKCVEELTTIKNEIIEDSSAVYHNAMKPNNFAALVPLARNQDICKAFELINLDSKFPIFGSTMHKHFEEAVARKPLEDKARLVFRSLYDNNDEKLPQLPEAFADQVFTYLSNDDLINLTLKF